MKRFYSIVQILFVCLSLFSSIVSAQEPGDTIPIDNPTNLDGNPGTVTPVDPGPFTPGRIIIPLDPYIPPMTIDSLVPVIPVYPNEPITEKILVDPTNPGIPKVDNKYTLGAVAGSLTVNGLGAAEYAVPIEVPNGGPLMPTLSLAYNSQNSTNGIAGYGFSLSGLSAITRGEKSMFNNNNKIEGITYSDTDNLFLDGKRLILISGSACQEGAVYCLEGDPYTKVTAHGHYSNTIASTWFEVKTPDGMTYNYGQTSDSKLTFQDKLGYQRISSWHINRTEDMKGNYMTVTYRQENYYPYPVKVAYGMNSVKDRGLQNKIELTYEDIGATPSYFFLETRKGSISKRIATITSSSNNEVYRKYYLSYDDASDKSTCRYARLVSIREETGNGDSLTPTTLTWTPLKDGSIERTQIYDPTLNLDPSITLEYDVAYMAADVTGDGISDILHLAVGTETDVFKRSTTRTFLLISRSTVNEQKQVKYLEPIIYKLPCPLAANKKNYGFDANSVMGGFNLSDLDGDGLNDLLLPYRQYAGDSWYCEYLYIICGKDILSGNQGFYKVDVEINPTSTHPLYTSFDFDGDGSDELLCLETSAVDGQFQAATIKYFMADNSQIAQSIKRCNLDIPEKPEKLFCGDYNNDGLTDIIVLHKNGYKIFYNRGGATNDLHFDNSVSKTGTSMKDQLRVDQGDFNGDGLPDFVYNVENESSIRIAYNTGDGTFTNSYSFDLGLSSKVKDEPEDHFLLRAIDMDRDGLSDVVVSKATYERKSNKAVFKEANVSWLKSYGTRLTLKNSCTKTNENDADEKLIFIGDFDGDGYIDLANSGSALNSQSSTITEKTLNLYHTSGATASTGRITGITDGLGNTSTISYGYLTSPDIYSAEHHMQSTTPVNTMTIPLPVVKQLNFSNGICRPNVIDYHYKDLYVQMTGAGVLGFGAVTKTMLNTGEASTDTITAWDVNRWIPEKTKSINTVGGKTSTVETAFLIQNQGNTYTSLEHYSTVTDMYGETVKTSNTYDTAKGVLKSQTVRNNGDNMYKKVAYSDYQEVSGVWLPGTVTMSQKHEHDSNVYSTTTKYTYDDNGNIVSTTVHSGTDLALTTNATYDEYGNCLSSYNSGKSVIKITKLNEYDSSGRFVIKSYQNPEAAVLTYTYDLWGNVLTENDCTDSNNVLTTTHTYDNWGRRASTTLPDGRKVKYSMGWGKTDQKHHYNFVEETGKPWLLTWFDKAGNETYSTTFGPKNVFIQKTTEYNSDGKVSQVTEQTGKLKTWKKISYDEMGRVLSEKSSMGNEVTYAYGNRTASSTTIGRTYTKTTDAWGNILSSTDPSGAKVIYRYGSNGLPSSITAEGSTVTIVYDCAGNRIYVTDPDAGTSKYEYAADGTLMKHTDARGVVTVNQYDALGRLSTATIGNQLVRNIYGTAGNEKLRLIKKQLNGNTIAYTHDKYGNVLVETRNIQGSGTFTTRYNYDDLNRLSSVKYDGLTPVSYSYDAYGFKTATSFAGKDIYRLQSYDGLTMKTAFADSLVFSRTVDSKGLERIRSLTYGTRELDHIVSEFDSLTLNLKTRNRRGYKQELFFYDDLDRLVGSIMGDEEIKGISYARNGNILSKSGLGTYSYNPSQKPHAVTSVENPASIIPTSELLTSFNDLGLIDRIEDSENIHYMGFAYGADLQRCYSSYYEDGKLTKKFIYANNMEIIQDKVQVSIYYLDENVILVQGGMKQGLHFIFKDHLGSILSAFDEKGTKAFEATYDAWGKQDVKLNMIGLRRGYTGHEMINEFGIINMNGRLYDPELGRFFSPDPYVQFPEFSQSYNRYSYCLNNPLKYTDPSGQLTEAAVFFLATSLFHIGKGMLHAQATGGNVIKAGLVSLLSSPLTSFGIGKLYGGTGSIGKELLRAGTHGLASGLASAMDGGSFGSFASGFISGGASAMATYVGMNGLSPEDMTGVQKADLALKAALVGGGASLLTGGNFLKGALIGYNIAVFNHFNGEVGDESLKESESNSHVLPVLVVTSKVPKYVYDFKDIANGLNTSPAILNTEFDSFGQNLVKFGKNSTIGNNMKIYWRSASQRPFYGNQYVSTYKLTPIGTKIVSKTTPIGYVIGGTRVAAGLCQDVEELNCYGQTDWYNTVHASASFGGALGGMKLGMCLGGAFGSAIGGVGALPCSVIGGTIFGIIGAFGGEKAAGIVVDYLYGK